MTKFEKYSVKSLQNENVLLPLSLRDRYNRYSKKTYQAGNTAYPLSTSASCGCSGLANLKGVRSFCIPIYKRIFDNNARPYQRFAAGAKCAQCRRTVHETDESRQTLQKPAYRAAFGKHRTADHSRRTLPRGGLYRREVVQRRRVRRLCLMYDVTSKLDALQNIYRRN